MRGEGEGDEGRESKLVDANIPQLPVSPEDSRCLVHMASCRVCLWFDSENWADVPQAMNEIQGLVKGSLLVESMQTMVQTGVRPPRGSHPMGDTSAAGASHAGTNDLIVQSITVPGGSVGGKQRETLLPT